MIYVLRFVLVVLYTIVFGSMGCLVGLVDRSGRGVEAVGRGWIRLILSTCAIRIEADGLENVPLDRPAVFMSNHESNFDIAAIVHTIPVHWRFVAKRELTWIPFFGWALKMGGHVIVDRSDNQSAVRSLQRAADQIRSGTNVIIFPEGTRSETGEMRPFKSGGFHLAMQAGVPIVPISVSGSRAITPKRSLRIHGGTIRVRYGKPIPTAGIDLAQRDALKAEVRRAILEGLRATEGASPPS